MKLIEFENFDLPSLARAIQGISIIVTIFLAIQYLEKPRPVQYSFFVKPQPKKRNDFSKSTKYDTKIRQLYACNDCKNPTYYWEFHHIDGDRSNNSPSNCEGLCPLCHAKKTRKTRFR